MKLKLFFLGILLAQNPINAQQLQFTYDSSGNQIQRELVTIQVNVLSRENPANSIDEIEESSESKISLENAQIDIYPNPVVDYLNGQWVFVCISNGDILINMVRRMNGYIL